MYKLFRPSCLGLLRTLGGRETLGLGARCFSVASSRRTVEDIKQNFGFEPVDPKEKQGKVNEVFSKVAEKYDVMNDAMSFGLHRIWKNQFIQELAPTPNMRLIDVASGTGDLAFRFLHYLDNHRGNGAPSANKTVTVCDINPEMLGVGMKRAADFGYQDRLAFRVGNAEDLSSEADNSYDAYTISFGIRNCTNLSKVIREAHRILKPGGRFMCLEFSRVDNDIFRQIYDFYSFQVIPPLGYLIASDWKSYQYLVESIRVFPDQEEFAELIRDSGFKMVTYKNMTNGIVAMHSGFKL